ncbi:MAG: hypothetical protein MZU91_14820, partial [Desulfosudis oleivorans]|nr:hypothetical protein [Desulfosudis oleivorans]
WQTLSEHSGLPEPYLVRPQDLLPALVDRLRRAADPGGHPGPDRDQGHRRAGDALPPAAGPGGAASVGAGPGPGAAGGLQHDPQLARHAAAVFRGVQPRALVARGAPGDPRGAEDLPVRTSPRVKDPGGALREHGGPRALPGGVELERAGLWPLQPALHPDQGPAGGRFHAESMTAGRCCWWTPGREDHQPSPALIKFQDALKVPAVQLVRGGGRLPPDSERRPDDPDRPGLPVPGRASVTSNGKEGRAGGRTRLSTTHLKSLQKILLQKKFLMLF